MPPRAPQNTTTCRRVRRAFILAILPLLAMAGCSPDRLVGEVTDVHGDPLPGVSVTMRGQGAQDLSDVWGRFRLPLTPGPVVLDLHKTGYTPGIYELNVDPDAELPDIRVKLWALPPAAGVYLYENGRYRPARALERESFPASDGLVYGTTKFDERDPGAARTADPEPILMCYGMPEGPVALHRLESAPVTIEGAGPQAEIEVLVPVAAVPAAAHAIDEPQGILRQVAFDEPLPPGVYALHWGALTESAGPDPRMFVFCVGDAAPRPDDAETTEDGSDDTDADEDDGEAG